jgi:hypothetical protein
MEYGYLSDERKDDEKQIRNRNNENKLIKFAKECLLEMNNDNNNNNNKKSFLFKSNNNEDEEEKIMECWTLLRSTFPPRMNHMNNGYSSSRNNGNEQKDHNLFTLSLSYQFYNSPNAFMKIQKIIARRCMFPIVIYHPSYDYIENKLLTLNESEIFETMNIVDNSIGCELEQKEHIDDKAKSITEEELKTAQRCL